MPGPGPGTEIAMNTLPFWSRFIVPADLRYDDVNATRTIISAGTVIPVFDYRSGEQNVSALNGAKSTSRDTLLTQANQTRGGGMYHIRGLSITKDGYPYVASDKNSDVGIVHNLWPGASVQPANGAGPLVPTVEDFRSLDSLMWEVFEKFFRLEIRIDGTRRILEMGPAPLYPGIGGPLSDVDTTNGGTYNSNYMHIPEGIVWNPAGTVDSNLMVALIADYDCVVPTWTAPDGLTPSGDPVSNAVPTALGRLWSQGWLLNFHGYEESPLSSVS